VTEQARPGAGSEHVHGLFGGRPAARQTRRAVVKSMYRIGDLDGLAVVGGVDEVAIACRSRRARHRRKPRTPPASPGSTTPPGTCVRRSPGQRLPDLTDNYKHHNKHDRNYHPL